MMEATARRADGILFRRSLRESEVLRSKASLEISYTRSLVRGLTLLQ